jgi:hypothetical protein
MKLLKTLLIAILACASIISFADDIKSEQDEVQKWVSLIQKSTEYQFKTESYGEELASRQMDVVNLLEDYMIIIEDAEYASYDGVDVSDDLKLAQSKLDRLAELKSIYSDYQKYKESENGSIVPYVVQTITEGVPQKRIKLPAIEALKMQRHTSVIEIERSRGTMTKVSFSDGDYFYFLNDRLYQTGGEDPEDRRTPERNHNNNTVF